MKKPKIPKTDSIKELAEFWETHDFTDFEDQMELVKGPIFKQQGIIQVKLEPKEAKAVKNLAKTKGVKDSDLVHQWIREKIRAA